MTWWRNDHGGLSVRRHFPTLSVNSRAGKQYQHRQARTYKKKPSPFSSTQSHDYQPRLESHAVLHSSTVLTSSYLEWLLLLKQPTVPPTRITLLAANYRSQHSCQSVSNTPARSQTVSLIRLHSSARTDHSKI